MKSRYSYSKSWYEDIIHHPSQYYVEPFKICGNLYFVGTKDSASHLLDTGDGLVLFDTGYPNMTGNLIQSIWKCGFKPESIRHIFHTHGHFDHFGATRLLMTLSEKTVTYMGAKDAEMLENKPELSLCHYLEGIKTEFFKPDIWLSDGETISIGNTYIKAISTPGHSMGAMTYQFGVRDDDKEYCAVLCGGTGFNTLNIDFIEKYHIDWRKDFEKSISIWKSMKTDIFLGNHTPQSKTLEKRKNLTEGVNNPFINSEDFYRYICNVEHNYHDMILQEG